MKCWGCKIEARKSDYFSPSNNYSPTQWMRYSRRRRNEPYARCATKNLMAGDENPSFVGVFLYRALAVDCISNDSPVNPSNLDGFGPEVSPHYPSEAPSVNVAQMVVPSAPTRTLASLKVMQWRIGIPVMIGVFQRILLDSFQGEEQRTLVKAATMTGPIHQSPLL